MSGGIAVNGEMPMHRQTNRRALAARRPTGRREGEAGKFEARRDGATDQRPSAHRPCRLPVMRRDQHLGHLATDDVGPQDGFGCRAVRRRDGEDEWRAGVPEPMFVRIDPMPMRVLMRLQQEQDRGAGRPPVSSRRRAPGLTIPSAFRMGRQVKGPRSAPSHPAHRRCASFHLKFYGCGNKGLGCCRRFMQPQSIKGGSSVKSR